MVGTVAVLGFAAVDHGVGEAADVSGGDPDLGVHDDGAIEADHIEGLAVEAGGWAADDILPPGVLEVAFEFDAEGAVVPESVDAAVDFGGLPDEAAAAAEGDEFFHFGGPGGGRLGLRLFLIRHDR